MDPKKLTAAKPAGLTLAALILLTTFAVYWQVHSFEFVNYDDQLYVYENEQVQKGLCPESIRWAFTTGATGNWHPVTWLSLMLDYELFDLDAGAYHLSNLAFHLANTALLFLLLIRMTGRLWPGAVVAAAFGLHPLHVESVAWVAERKDVLSTFFALLTMAAYLRYCRRPGLIGYLLVAAIFALGLMAKPMLVTLPFVLLLLDYWPLGRWRLLRSEPPKQTTNPSSVTRLIRKITRPVLLEKWPLFLLAAVSSVITYLVQRAEETFMVVPVSVRLANAVVSYGTYIGKMFWPGKLAVFYPYYEMPPVSQIFAAALLLLGLSGLAFFWRRRRPWLLLGWLWYLITLLPVIGLVQVGAQARADRYCYVPLIGLFVILAGPAPKSPTAGEPPGCTSTEPACVSPADTILVGCSIIVKFLFLGKLAF